MGKHSKEKKPIKIGKYIVIIIIIVALTIIGIYAYKNYDIIKNKFSDFFIKQESVNYSSIINHTTIENERLVIKSLSTYNKIIEYTFEEDTLKTVTIYQQFEEQEKFENKKESYEKQDNIVIKNINEAELSIEIEKTQFGTDTELSYKELCDKYLVQMIGAYEKI